MVKKKSKKRYRQFSRLGIGFLFILFGCTITTKNLFKSKKRPELVEEFNLPKNHVKRFKTSPAKKKKEIVKISKDQDIGIHYPPHYPVELKKYDLLSKSVWDKFQPRVFQGEEIIMSVRYLGITTGHVKISTMPPVNIDGKTAYYFKGYLKSAKFYEFIYSLDDTVETFVGENFLPIKYTLVQKESVQDVNDLQLFDQDSLQTYFWYKRIKRGKLKKKHITTFIPYYTQDSFSVLFFLRGLPLKKGITFQFPIITRAKIWLFKMTVAGIEEIRVADKTWSALKVQTETKYPGVLQKRGDIIFWYSNDELRIPLKFKAKVKLGSLYGELIKYKNPY